MKADKIYLVGFMAAGKTTVARALATRLGWRAEDVDELIEARERRPVADIFARNGEPYFRTVEREILKVLLPLRHVVGRRPLAADRSQMERLFAVRRIAYAQAHLRVDVGTSSAGDIAEQIADHLES